MCQELSAWTQDPGGPGLHYRLPAGSVALGSFLTLGLSFLIPMRGTEQHPSPGLRIVQGDAEWKIQVGSCPPAHHHHLEHLVLTDTSIPAAQATGLLRHVCL